MLTFLLCACDGSTDAGSVDGGPPLEDAGSVDGGPPLEDAGSTEDAASPLDPDAAAPWKDSGVDEDASAPGDASFPDVDAPECQEGAQQVEACGLNQRGEAVRQCEAGRWGEASGCSDPDECSDGAQETRACGLNLQGEELRDCASGHWSAWSACVDPDSCGNGASEQRACGINQRGSQSRSCSAGAWGEFGDCVDVDECSDGAHEERPCGLNLQALEERDCTSGHWSAWSACVDLDSCVNGAAEPRACGINGRGTQSRSCSAGQWGGFGECVDPDECADGASQTGSCGPNARGTEERSCSQGAWSEWSSCADDDVCADWGTSTVACGLNDRGSLLLVCQEGAWQDWYGCNDPDECVDGVSELRPCGKDLLAQLERVCTQGHWSYGTCSQVCGNSSAEAPEQCDDGNYAMMDGCFSCEVEHVEWMHYVRSPRGAFSQGGGPLADGGLLYFASVGYSYGVDTLLVHVGTDGEVLLEKDLEYTGSNLQPFALLDQELDVLHVTGSLQGSIPGLALSSVDATRSFLASVDAEGVVRNSGLFELASGAELNRPWIRAVPGGGVVAQGALPLNDVLSFGGELLADTRNLDPVWKSAYYVVRFDSEGAVRFSGVALSDSEEPRFWVTDEDDERSLVRMWATSRLAWLGSDDALELESEAAVLSLDHDGQVAFFSPLAASAELTWAYALADGAAGVSLGFAYDQQRVRVLDSAGQTLFEVPGMFPRPRSDGAVVVEGWFTGAQATIAEGTPEERTFVAAHPSGRTIYTAVYDMTGKLLDAGLVISTPDPYADVRITPGAHGFGVATSCPTGSVLGEGESARAVSEAGPQICAARFDDAGRLVWSQLLSGQSAGYGYPQMQGDDLWLVSPADAIGSRSGLAAQMALVHWDADGALLFAEVLTRSLAGNFPHQAKLLLRGAGAWLELRASGWGYAPVFFPDEPYGGFGMSQYTAYAKLRPPF